MHLPPQNRRKSALHIFTRDMLNLFARPDCLPRTLALTAACILALWLSHVDVSAQTEPAGLLLFQEPATSYTEAFEYRNFRQDNALYATVITTSGQRKKLKAGGVLAVLPYPPADFDPYFAETAKSALAKIETLEATHSSVRTELERVRGKWVRALAVFQQEAERSRDTLPRPTLTPKRQTLPETAPSAVTPDSASAAAPNDLNLTGRVEAIGRQVIGRSSHMLGMADRTFSVWTFFVVLPGLVVVLLIMVIWMARRPSITRLPPGGPNP